MCEQLRDYFISAFDIFLESIGVDTACIMGYGYSFEDVKIGSTFYFSYLYYGRLATVRNGASLQDTLKAVLAQHKPIFDKYKLVKKYRIVDTYIFDDNTKKVVAKNTRREYVLIKNLRTKEVVFIDDIVVDNFKLLCWVSLD